MPERIQRKRTKGWRMPDGAVYVGRPSVWGNPFLVVYSPRLKWFVYDDRGHSAGHGYVASFPTQVEAAQRAVRMYQRYMYRQWDLTELRGRDLACWCPLDQPCHADVLLEIANGETSCAS